MGIHSKISNKIENIRQTLSSVSREIHQNPELGFQEQHASRLLSETLSNENIPVEKGVFGLETAFQGIIKGSKPGPRIVICAEYDALPDIGHACGHNLIGTGAIGAAIGLFAVKEEISGEIIVLGTPAEEGGGGKIKLLQNGAFQNVDAAMMFHPFDRDLLSNPALASSFLTFEFQGTPSHAAAAPWDGSSALSAVIQTFNLIDSARLHFRDGARVHGIITNGGQAVNIIPERTEAKFSVRAPSASYLPTVVARVIHCAKAAASAAGCKVNILERPGYKDMINNMKMATHFGTILENLGRKAVSQDPSAGAGSTDMGDVSYAVPSIHPYLSICEKGEAMCHQHAFVSHANSDTGVEAMIVASKAMAQLALDLSNDDTLLQSVKEEHTRALQER